MPLITPRRRFLFMAPLALLLPAGLLTYLGLELVNLVDTRYEERAAEIVDRISLSIRNSAREGLNTEVLAPFRAAVVPEMPDWDIESDRITTEPLSNSIESIFVFSDNQVLFYYPTDPQSVTNTVWVSKPNESAPFVTRLESALQIDVVQYQTQARYMPTFYNYFPLIYPDRFDLQQPPDQMAFYTFLEFSDWEFDQPPPAAINAIGFTLDAEAVTTRLFQNLIDRMWQFRDELPYPVAIYTRDGRSMIAQPDIVGSTFIPSTRYNPSRFDERLFPWLVVQYSDQTGNNFLQGATNEKLFYYLLILTANICMIAAVVGALRDISRELVLSDMRSNFVARVSHELRTPLGLIRLFAETLEMGRVDNQEKRHEYLHAITKESERLTNLINNILNFSQIEANTMRYSMSPQSITPIIEESLDTMHYHFKRHDFTVSCEIEDNLPQTNIDADAIQQVLFNLFSNAVKYGAKGEWLGVNAFREKDMIRIDVSDHGFGISSELQEKVFQEFFRVDDSRVRETGGSGLGLAVVRHIVQAHHGTIRIQSEPDEGTTFIIHLPIVEPQPSEATA